MRILLDESLPMDLAPLITGHQVTTVRAAGWSSIKNGRLLALAASQYDFFLTMDLNLENQDHPATLPTDRIREACRYPHDDAHRPAPALRLQ